jgi:hypothetical protein
MTNEQGAAPAVPAYPEHNKLTVRRADRDAIADFLDWTDSQSRYVVGQWVGAAGHEEFMPLGDNERAVMIGKYLGIDRDALMAEKDAMLEDIREANRRAS